jgi:WD40 repeat protein
MQGDIRKLVHAVAPRPSAGLDVEAMWERAGRQRVIRRFVATSLLAALSVGAWATIQNGYVTRLFEDGRVGPADVGEPSPVESPPESPSGTLYLENLCGQIGDCSLTVIDLDTGTSHTVPVPQLALGDAQFRIEHSGSKLVFRGSMSRSTGSDIATFALNLDLKDPPRNIGESWYFVPSATEGRVWLAILDPESPSTVRALKAVREVTVDGKTTVPDAALPEGRWSTVVGAVTNGVVFQGGQGEDGLQVWDPLAKEVVMSLPGPFAADTHATLIAWCDVGCEEMHITDAATRNDVIVQPGEEFAFEETYYGAFSPDGSLLAVPVVSDDGQTQVALVDVRQGTASVIKGSERDESYGSIAWSSTGEWVFFNAGDGRIMAYRPGSPEAQFIPVEVEGTVWGMASS